jgi:hypothetical protein
MHVGLHHEIQLVSCRLTVDHMVWVCDKDTLSNVKMIQARKGRNFKHAVNFSYYGISTKLNILFISGTSILNTVPNI